MIHHAMARTTLSRQFFWGLIGWLMAGMLTTAVAAKPTPEMAVKTAQSTADQIIKEIASHQDEVNKDPKALLTIVRQVLLPHIDSERMSRLVLGRYWRTATPAQKTAFTDQFEQLLVRTYAGPLSKLGNQKIEVTGTKPGAEADEIVVQSMLSGGDLGRVPVEYRMVQDGDAWKAYDVIIDGISLVNNYRGSFAQVIQQKGLGSLIDTLKSQNNG
ncbi:MlaC/ttg2D family ABC transporter substrate-binding protein [Halothiobacillus diazotrophicus]|nr:ABC transporter substrate-binding protein [Halothiobacillus diazotrophicus]